MSYNIERYLKTLELDKILELLANETTIADSAELARNILPETDFEAVKKALRQTDDAYIFMSKYTAPNFSGATNVSSSLIRAASSAVLSMAELIRVAETLRAIRSIC